MKSSYIFKLITVKLLLGLFFLLLLLGCFSLCLCLLVFLNQLFDLTKINVVNASKCYTRILKCKGSCHLVSRQDLDLSFVVLPGEGGQLDLLWSQLGHVQSLGQHLDGEVQRVLQTRLVLFVFLLQHRHGRVPVVSNAGGLPPSIVSCTQSNVSSKAWRGRRAERFPARYFESRLARQSQSSREILLD